MRSLTLFCVLIAIGLVSSADAVKKQRRYRKRQAGGSYAGTSTGAGGYAGGYNDDYGGYGFGYGGTGYDFGAGFIDPYLFHQQLTAQILADHAAQNNAIVSTSSWGDAQASANAAILPDDLAIQQQIASQQSYFGNNRRQNLYGNAGFSNHRYAPNFAAASASLGPGGYHQTAFINPANPSIPNISNRFGASSPGGYKGVSVSSFSSSSNVNGKPTSYRGAQTTVNDNGKITSYSVHS